MAQCLECYCMIIWLYSESTKIIQVTNCRLNLLFSRAFPKIVSDDRHDFLQYAIGKLRRYCMGVDRQDKLLKINIQPNLIPSVLLVY
jgi:hypothetical protein